MDSSEDENEVVETVRKELTLADGDKMLPGHTQKNTPRDENCGFHNILDQLPKNGKKYAFKRGQHMKAVFITKIGGKS